MFQPPKQFYFISDVISYFNMKPRFRHKNNRNTPKLTDSSYIYALVGLSNVNSRSRSLYAVARPSVVCLSVHVCGSAK